MKTLLCLTKRNIKIFFKDKGLVISSLITPIILLVLYVTFLAKVYRESFRSARLRRSFLLRSLPSAALPLRSAATS